MEVPGGKETMKAMDRRLRRLERRLAPAVECKASLELYARMEAGRRRLGLPPVSPEQRAERSAELRGMSIHEILHAGRQRVADGLTGHREYSNLAIKARLDKARLD